jgi:hypothetical protein
MKERSLGACMGLRAELSERSLRYAAANGLTFEQTDGEMPSVVFACEENGRHGNFHPLAYERIAAEPAWARRLEKVHTASKRVRVRANWRWRELDCASSSDALLMNVFCYPRVMERTAVCAVLGVEVNAVPEFGFRPATPMSDKLCDRTEVDMKIGDLLVEAKLTESDFQTASASLLARYRDIEEVFETNDLPVVGGRQLGYQLIRGTLAAHATGCSFCVLCDARRPELVERWYRVMRAVRSAELRCRLKILTWQELAEALPAELQEFLAVKYGISARNSGLEVDAR